MALSGVFRTNSAAETEALGEALASELAPGDRVALIGELGAGKTAFTRGVARGLGAGRGVKSPSFTIINIYEGGRLPLYHVDLYRIAGPTELESAGLDDYLYGGGVAVVEWAERSPELAADCAVTVRINYLSGDGRELIIERSGEKKR